MKKLGLLASVPYFMVPALLMLVTLYAIEPILVGFGIPPYYAGGICLYVPLGALGLCAFVGYSKEHREKGKALPRLLERFRYRPFKPLDYLLALALTLVSLFSYSLISRYISEPLFLSVFGDHAVPWVLHHAKDSDWGSLVGGHVTGNWLLLASSIVFFLFNVIGEELWWRGYLLSRQELAMGKKAWLANGAFWALFHLPKFWTIPAVLPLALLGAFVSQKRANNGIFLVVHSVAVGLSTLDIALRVLA